MRGPYYLGIDLGTTFSAAATVRDGRPETVFLGSHTAAIPSTVLLRDDGTWLVGEAAERRGNSEPDRVAREFKRRFGDPVPLILGGTPQSPEALTGRLLQHVYAAVVEREGSEPAGVVLTHPANWGEYKIDLLRMSVRLAGLDGASAVGFTTEPEAAAIHYAAGQAVPVGAIVAVYDLGGGTFDAAVLRRTAGAFEVLGEPQGIERLGGIDIDAAVLDHARSLLGPALTALNPDDPVALAALLGLRRSCTEAKEALSADFDASFTVVLPTVPIEIRMTRAELEQRIRPVLEDTVATLRRALQSAGIGRGALHAVLLVGGSSRIPLVGQIVAEALRAPIALDTDPKHAVARGAAVLAALQATAGVETAVVPVVTAAPGEPDLQPAPSTYEPPPPAPTPPEPPAAPPSTPPTPPPTPPVPPEPEPFPVAAGGSQRRVPGVLIGAGVVVVTILIVVAIALLQGGDDPGGGGVAIDETTTTATTAEVADTTTTAAVEETTTTSTTLPEPVEIERILFQVDSADDVEIWSMAPDGSDPVPLIDSDGVDLLPAISPDRTQVVYTHGFGQGFEVRVAAADGTGEPEILLANDEIEGFHRATWLPDGRAIVVPVGSELGIIDIESGEVEILPLQTPDGDCLHNDPTVSPDGLLVAYRCIFGSGDDAEHEVYIGDINTGDVFALAPFPGQIDTDPWWTRDGSQLVFRSDRDGDGEIWLVDSDGDPGSLRQLTHNDLVDQDPVVLPDGRVVYSSEVVPDVDVDLEVLDLAIVDEEGDGFPLLVRPDIDGVPAG